MRLIVDSLIVVMLTVALVALLVHQRSERHQVDRIEAVQRAMYAIQSEALFRAALGEVEATPRGYARVIRTAWFDHRPRNLLVEDDAALPAWLEHVDPALRDRSNPERIVADQHHPPFWYNPYEGVVRARVPMQFSRRGTLDLYNAINATSLEVDQVDWPSRASRLPGISMADSADIEQLDPAIADEQDWLHRLRRSREAPTP